MQRTLPPYARLLGIDFASHDDGEHGPPLLVMPFSGNVLGRPGFLHGGAIAGLLEMAAIVALLEAATDTPSIGRVKPINMTTDFMRGGRDAPTFARGNIGRLGNRVANVDVLAWQNDRDRPIARAHMNFLLVAKAPD